MGLSNRQILFFIVAVIATIGIIIAIVMMKKKSTEYFASYTPEQENMVRNLMVLGKTRDEIVDELNGSDITIDQIDEIISTSETVAPTNAILDSSPTPTITAAALATIDPTAEVPLETLAPALAAILDSSSTVTAAALATVAPTAQVPLETLAPALAAILDSSSTVTAAALATVAPTAQIPVASLAPALASILDLSSTPTPTVTAAVLAAVSPAAQVSVATLAPSVVSVLDLSPSPSPTPFITPSGKINVVGLLTTPMPDITKPSSKTFDIIMAMTTAAPTTMAPTTAAPTTMAPTTAAPTTVAPTTRAPTTAAPTTMAPTTAAPTTMAPTTAAPTTRAPATAAPTTMAPTTPVPTTMAPTTAAPTTMAPTTAAPTTMAPTTAAPTTRAPTTAAPTTMAPTTAAPTTRAPTTAAPTTMAPTTAAPTTMAPTTAPTTAVPGPEKQIFLYNPDTRGEINATIPPNVEEIDVTLIGGGGGCGWGTSYCGGQALPANIKTPYRLAGDAGSVVKFKIKPGDIRKFNAWIGGPGQATDKCMENINNGGMTNFYIGGYFNRAFGGKGGSFKQSKGVSSRFNQVSYLAGGDDSPIYSTINNGYGYGNGEVAGVYTTPGIPAGGGAVILEYKYKNSIPKSIATNGYMERVFNYTDGRLILMDIPEGTRYIAFVAAGGGGGGWSGGVSNYQDLPAGKGYPSNYRVFYNSYKGNTFPINFDYVLYGGPPGAGGAAAPAFVCSGRKQAISPPQKNGNLIIISFDTDKPKGLIGIVVGKGGAGAVPGGVAGNGEATAVYIQGKFNAFFPGGMGATGPISPGTGSNWNWNSSFPFTPFPQLGNVPNAFESKPDNASGKTRTTIDQNGVYVSTVDNSEQRYGVGPFTGGNGGAFTYSDAGWGSIFGTVTHDVYDTAVDPNDPIIVKNGLPGCGGRGGDAYIYEPNGKDKGVDPSTIKGNPGGNGGDGFVRMFFMKNAGF